MSVMTRALFTVVLVFLVTRDAMRASRLVVWKSEKEKKMGEMRLVLGWSALMQYKFLR